MGRKIIIYLFLLCFVRTNYAYSQAQYFVSPNGKDTGKGDIDSPFLSIEKAKQESRKQNGITTIYLREGVYRLEQPLVLTSEDGNGEKQLIICAYPEEKVIITSGVTLHPNWEHYKKNIMKSSVKESVIMDQLFVNGSYRPMARYPSTAVRFNGPSAQATSTERIKKWKAPKGGYLHVMHASDWGDIHYQIVEKNKNNTLRLEGGWQNNRPSAGHIQNRMVENIFEEETTIYLSNNKRKSLRRAKYIVNFDYGIGEIEKYNINRTAILINIEQKVKIESMAFEGISINNVNIQIPDELIEHFGRMMEKINKNILYMSLVNQKQELARIKDRIKEDNIHILNLIGDKGIISQEEFKRIP